MGKYNVTLRRKSRFPMETCEGSLFDPITGCCPVELKVSIPSCEQERGPNCNARVVYVPSFPSTVANTARTQPCEGRGWTVDDGRWTEQPTEMCGCGF